ncbi:DUF2065 domain-containing protein [Blastochloris viridis]|uniref:Inner membrane protein YjeT n=2 Tax=Blastochloris viridis TaxID=1079 RepID=A0A0P0IHW5_BLAVI|nr:DUF2065 domain-containing protein [Blastochloris viridis]ALK10680.1 hypothetical protein BVIR_2917 [Blastochloris viridis]CUU43343.1 hypothetical protein BVIRIDIS_23620 [Blastochloris viridis]
MGDFVVALGLMLAIEGLLYAAAPDAMRRAVARILDTPDVALRIGGLTMAVFGVALVWMIRG